TSTAPATVIATSTVAAQPPARAPVAWTPAPRVIVRAPDVAPVAHAPTALTPPASTAASTGATGGAHKASCESPFVIDADGIRQIKSECM
ncbi:MAG: hypothetical protein JWO86_661, partial [Myxococcaceae bacterium]|nr:hypothetical protein [Myxococcaceae bacterium]